MGRDDLHRQARLACPDSYPAAGSPLPRPACDGRLPLSGPLRGIHRLSGVCAARWRGRGLAAGPDSGCRTGRGAWPWLRSASTWTARSGGSTGASSAASSSTWDGAFTAACSTRDPRSPTRGASGPMSSTPSAPWGRPTSAGRAGTSCPATTGPAEGGPTGTRTLRGAVLGARQRDVRRLAGRPAQRRRLRVHGPAVGEGTAQV
jgi:hypothetical protein